MRYFVYLVSIFFGVFLLGMILLWIKDYITRNRRKLDRKEDFTNYFVGKEISESLVLSVYYYLQDWMSFNEFPVRPQDILADIYGIVDEELDDLIIETAKQNGLKIPLNSEYWGRPIITVEDLIQFINSFAQKDS